MGEDIHDMTWHNEITAETERVFFEVVKGGEDDIIRAWSSGKDVLCL